MTIYKSNDLFMQKNEEHEKNDFNHHYSGICN